jgi:Fic family protein
MYTPTFDLTHTMVKDLIKLELAIKEIRTTPLPQESKDQIEQQMDAKSIYHVAKLAGISLKEEDAADIASGETIPAPGSETVLLSNYRSTSDFIYASTKDPYLSLSSSILLHINKLLLNTAVESWEVGRFRTLGDTIQSAFDTWTNHAPKTIDIKDPAQYYTSVLSWFINKRHPIHPMLKIGVVVYELFAYYPFVAGNQITIIAMSELLYERSSLSLKGFFPVSRVFHLNEKELLEALIDTRENGGDQTRWLERFVNAVASDLTSLKNDVVKATEKKIYAHKKKMADLNPRQKKFLEQLSYKHKMSRKDFVEMTGVSSMTAYRDISELLDRDLIIQKGGGRSTHYVLPEKKEETLEEAEARPRNVIRVIGDYDSVMSPHHDDDDDSADGYGVF